MKKLNLNLWLFLSLFCIGLLTSCEDDDDDNNSDLLTAQEFMLQAASSDSLEIQTGSMAVQKGNIAEVEQYGQHLVDEHMMTSTKLKTLATQKNVILPNSMTTEHKDKRNRLAGETGKTFDQDFANVQIEAHQKAIALYQEASEEVSDPDVRTFATATLPALQQHLLMAQALKTKTDAE